MVLCRLGSIQNIAKSLDLVRNLLQKFINKEIDMIVQKYVMVTYMFFMSVTFSNCSAYLQLVISYLYYKFFNVCMLA